MRSAGHGIRIYSVTPSHAALDSASRHWEAAQHRLRSVLGEADWQVFISVCDRVCAAAKQAETMRLAFSRDRVADRPASSPHLL